MEIKKLVKKAIKSGKISDLEAAFKHADQDGPEPVQLLIDSDWIAGHDWFRKNGSRNWIEVVANVIELDFYQLAKRNEVEFARYLIENQGIIPSDNTIFETFNICIEKGYNQFLELLLNDVAPVLAEDDFYSEEPLDKFYELNPIIMIRKCLAFGANEALVLVLKNVSEKFVFSGRDEHEMFLLRFRGECPSLREVLSNKKAAEEREDTGTEEEDAERQTEEDDDDIEAFESCESDERDEYLTSSQLRLLALIYESQEWQLLTELSSKFELSEINRFAFVLPKQVQFDFFYNQRKFGVLTQIDAETLRLYCHGTVSAKIPFAFEILAEFADLQSLSKNNETSLHLACILRDEKLLYFLIESTNSNKILQDHAASIIKYCTQLEWEDGFSVLSSYLEPSMKSEAAEQLSLLKKRREERLRRRDSLSKGMELALQPDCPKSVLSKLAKSRNRKARILVADLEHCPADILDILSRDRVINVRKTVAKRYSLPLNVVNTLSMDDVEEIRLIISGYIKSHRCSDEQLREISMNGTTSSRICAAGNDNCPEDVLMKLSRDSSTEVRQAVANRSRLPSKIVDILSNDPISDIRIRMLFQEHASESTLGRIISAEAPVNLKYIMPPYGIVPPAVEQLLRFCEHPLIRAEFARDPQTATKDLERYALDQDDDVRIAVAYNQSCPSRVLEILTRDVNPNIRSMAQKRCTKTA